jgi:hypothetical protein
MRGICLATAVGLTLVLGACGSDGESPSDGAAAATSTAEQTMPSSTTSPRPADRQADSVETGKDAAEDERASGNTSPTAKQIEPYRKDFQRKRDAAERQQRENEREAAAVPPAPIPTPKPKPGCHPSYRPCLDPSPSDYDCKGSSDDGPAYTGPVIVFGPDEYELDPDGNGAGCDAGE